MISVILYGRNDSHGYNLPKRAAISLNCIAEVLSDPDDEILFVDYNTPDDLPTYIEAVYDTLTPSGEIAAARVSRPAASDPHRQAEPPLRPGSAIPKHRHPAVESKKPLAPVHQLGHDFSSARGSFRLDRRRSRPPRRTVYSAPIRTARAIVGDLFPEAIRRPSCELAGASGPRCTWMRSRWRSPPTGSISRAIFSLRRGRPCGTSTDSTNA